jgi:hypothetical protein
MASSQKRGFEKLGSELAVTFREVAVDRFVLGV